MVKVVKVAKFTVSEAIARLLLPKTIEGRRIQIATAIWDQEEAQLDSALSGAGDVAKIRKQVSAIRSRMAELKLSDDHRMHRALWLRLFAEARVKVSSDALAPRRNETSNGARRLMLHQVRNAPLLPWTGPDVNVEGFELGRGWSFIHVVLADLGFTPYARQWRLVEICPTGGASPSTVTGAGIGGGRTGKTVATTPRPLGMTEDDYRARYGTNLVDALKRACAKNATRPDGVVRKSSGSYARPFTADCSTEVVVEHLLNRERALLSVYRKTTLQRALPLWVQCPFGRPKKSALKKARTVKRGGRPARAATTKKSSRPRFG